MPELMVVKPRDVFVLCREEVGGEPVRLDGMCTKIPSPSLFLHQHPIDFPEEKGEGQGVAARLSECGSRSSSPKAAQSFLFTHFARLLIRACYLTSTSWEVAREGELWHRVRATDQQDLHAQK